MEVDRLSVILDANISPLVRGFKTAATEAKKFESEIGKIGTSSDKSAAQGQTAFSKLTKSIQDTRNEASKGANFETRADTRELDGVGNLISRIRAQVSRGASFNVKSDTSGIVKTGAELDRIDEKADNLDGRTINIDIDKDKINGAASGVDGLAGKLRDLGAVLAVGSVPALVAGIAAIPAVASAAAAGVGALAIGLGAGLAGAAAIGGGAVAMFAAGTKAAEGIMAQAVANALLLGDGFGTLAGEVKAAGDQVKSANDLIAMMPAGTAAAAAAQERLTLAQQYQADATQIQIDWWNKYGDAANSLQFAVNDLRLGFVAMTSDIGGQLLPVLTEFVNFGADNLGMLQGPLDDLVAGTNEAAGGFLRMLESGNNLNILQNIFNLVGQSAGMALNIIGDGAIIALQAIAVMLPEIQYLEQSMSVLATTAAMWSQSAQGATVIQDTWSVLVDYGNQLVGILGNLGVGFYNIGDALYASGLVDLTMGGLDTMAQAFRDITTNSSGLADNLSMIGPVLSAVGGLASTVAEQFLYMADAVLHATNPDTGNNTLVELIDSLSAAVPPLADILIGTFEQLAPAISRNVGPISEFIGTFIGSSGTLVHVIDFLGGLADTFNNMPDPIKSAVVEIAAFSAVMSVLGGGDLAQTAFYATGATYNIGKMGYAVATTTPAVWEFAAANASLLLSLIPLAALGAIAIDILINLPDMATAFSGAYEEAQAGGESTGQSFVAGLNAAIDETTILGTIASVVDAGIAYLDTLAPETSILDVILGKGEAEDNPILAQIMPWYEDATSWWTSLEPDTSLLDVIMGRGEAEDNPLLSTLSDAWSGVTDWISSLVPDVSILDILFGATAEGGDAATAVLTKLGDMWAGVTDWLSSLVPEITLMDIITGVTGADEDQVQPILDKLNTIWGYVTEIWDGIKQDTSDAWSYIYNDVILYYVSSITTSISDFLNSIYNDYWLYYFGADGTLVTAISDFFSVLYNDWFLYYLGSDGTIVTAVSDFFSVLYNDWWLYYFGTDGALITPIVDFFSMLYNDYFLYYLGPDGTIITAVSDFFSVVYNDWFLYYFGTDGAFIAPIIEFFDTLYNDYFLYYLGSDGVVVTAVSDAWTAITDSITPFTDSFTQLLSDGIKAGVDAALGWFKTLLEGASSVLSAIGADNTAAALTDAANALPITTEAYHGLATDQMRTGGRRGGKGTPGAHSRLIEWNEQGNGVEYWIATGDPDKNRQRSLTAQAAAELGMKVAPMARGGSSGATGDPGIWHMSIGGGTDLGPGGLSGEAAQIAQEVMDMFGVWANTYTGDPSVGGEHGSLHGNTHENTFDFWADSAFDPLDVGTGDAIESYVFEKYGSDLDTVIWQGMGTGPSGAFYDDDHYDHLHMSVGGSGLSNTAGVMANALFQMAKKVWDGVVSALGSADFGNGPIWDGVEQFANTMPSMAWEFLLRQIPRGWGAAKSFVGNITGDIQDLLSQGVNAAGWGADELAALIQLWGNESGLDPNAVNPDSGAYGIPQINPSSWGTPAPLGDAASQIDWGINYIMDRYGSPSAALDFWYANDWYRAGGLVRGAPGSPQIIGAHGGERVLPRGLTAGFDRLAHSIQLWSAKGSGAAGTMDSRSSESKLDAILEAIERGMDSETPVRVTNTGDFHRGFVAGALAAQASEAGAEIMDDHISEGIRYYREFSGSTT